MSISRDTFDPAKNYKRVRCHQDRDLLDSELNEQQDITNQERRKLADILFKEGANNVTQRKVVALHKFDRETGDVTATVREKSNFFLQDLLGTLPGMGNYCIAMMCSEKDLLNCHRAIFVART